MKDLDSKKPAKYADSSISDKAFKRMLLWFFIYCSLFCIGVVFAINADMGL
jgi:Trk-type K+ transport system membrane component